MRGHERFELKRISHQVHTHRTDMKGQAISCLATSVHIDVSERFGAFHAKHRSASLRPFENLCCPT